MPVRPALLLSLCVPALCLPALGACGLFGASPAPDPPLPFATADTGPYRVQTGDVLSIKLFYTPEWNEDVTVRPDGRITTALAEAVPARGRSPEAIAAELRPLYARELRDPKLTVEVKDFAPSRVYVAGEVYSPGELTTSGPGLTLLQAVARAGGVRLSGDTGRVFIVRRGDDDRPLILATRFDAAAEGRDPAADIRLQSYDVVIVPKTGIARVYAWVNQHIQQFVPVSWGFSYNLNPIVTGRH